MFDLNGKSIMSIFTKMKTHKIFYAINVFVGAVFKYYEHPN